jgi:hypothetical protein
MEDEIDALFKLPLGEFIPARNALAARLKKAGQRAQAHAAKALPKPSVPAWVVNQLYWWHREPFDRLIEAGDRFRQAQSTQRTRNSAAMRGHLEARRNAQAALARIATAVLHDAGSGGTRDVLRRVTSTLEALATYGSLPGAPRAGRLTAEVAPPGFDMVASLLPLTGGAPRPTRGKGARNAAVRRGEKERRRLATAAKAAVRESERALRAARMQAERAAATFQTAAKRAKDSERRRVKAEKQLAKLVTEANAAYAHAREAEANAEQASRAAEGAERALELARRKLDEL